MAQQTDDTMGFPRLPFNPTPPPDLMNRALTGADDDPAAALRRVVEIFVQHMGLQQRNNDFSARFYGTADVAEEASEHWNYLRNANFLSLTYKWVNNASLTRAAITSSLPYGVPRAIQLQNNVGTKNWIQQSCSATGATWYVADGWINNVAGNGKAGFEVLENSGSSTSRLKAVYFPVSNGDWRRMGDFRNSAGLTFKTYKGTTRLTFRCVLGSSMAAQYAEVGLEKGRRRHPWRLNLLDRGNLVTSLKTAGSASAVGNLVASRAGAIRIRQVSTTKFVWSNSVLATASAATPQPVSATGNVGTTTTLFAREGHVHKGVRSLRTAGSASAHGRLQVSASGGAAIRQVAGKFIWGAPSVSAATPKVVSGTGTVGTSVKYSREDHVHKGVRGIKTAGSASASGTLTLSGSGAVRFRQVATKKFVASTTGLLVVASTTPAKVSTAGTVGVGTTAARADHVHRGVTALKYGGTSNDGTLSISGSGTGWGLAWSGTKLKVGFPKPATATPTGVSTSGTVGTGTLWSRTDHRHRGVKAVRVRGAQGSASGTVRFSQSSNVTLRRSGSTVIVGATGGSGFTQACRVYNSANISVNNSTWTSMTFNSERFDTDTMHSTVSNTSRITFTTAGTYIVIGQVYWASNTTGQRGLRLLLNGATVIAEIYEDAASADVLHDIATIYAFSATDYVELQGFQTSGGALNSTASGNISPEFMAHRMS